MARHKKLVLSDQYLVKTAKRVIPEHLITTTKLEIYGFDISGHSQRLMRIYNILVRHHLSIRELVGIMLHCGNIYGSVVTDGRTRDKLIGLGYMKRTSLGVYVLDENGKRLLEEVMLALQEE